MSAQVFSTEPNKVPLSGHPLTEPDDGLWALVPMKALEDAKQRLKDHLGADRKGFTVAMLRDVLAALNQSRKISHLAVVTADPQVAVIAKRGGVLVVDEVEPKGMNKALEVGLETIREMGGQRIAIIPADIPLITGLEADRLVHELQVQRRAREVELTGIGPSKNLGGTNFLYMEASNLLPLMFGPDSYRRHMTCALEHGSQPVSLHSPAISLDIDEYKDLKDFITVCLSNSEHQKTRSWQFLKEKGFVDNMARQWK